MTAPMTAWMRYRGMPRRATVEDVGGDADHRDRPALLGAVGVVRAGDMALVEHGLMMPAMLIPMPFRSDLYSGRGSHPARIGR